MVFIHKLFLGERKNDIAGLLTERAERSFNLSGFSLILSINDS